MRLGNETETTWTFDRERFRLTRLVTARSGRTYLDIAYTYDPVGNVTGFVDRVQDAGSTAALIHGASVSSAQEFRYDAWYRLVSAIGRVH